MPPRRRKRRTRRRRAAPRFPTSARPPRGRSYHKTQFSDPTPGGPLSVTTRGRGAVLVLRQLSWGSRRGTIDMITHGADGSKGSVRRLRLGARRWTAHQHATFEDKRAAFGDGGPLGERSLVGPDVPHPRGLVHARGDHARAVGAERGALPLVLMLERAGERLAGRRVPYSRGLVLACGDHARAVGAERGAPHRGLMREGAGERLAGRRVPHSRGL